MLQFLIGLYVFFISFTGAFALSTWLRLHVVLIILIMPIALISFLRKSTINTKCYKSEDVFIALLFIGLSLSTLVNSNPRSLNYLSAYFFIFGLSFLFLKGVVYNFCSVRRLLNINSSAVLFVAFFTNLDFFSYYFLNFDIQLFLPRSREASATYLGIFRRAYGFATEPTILGLYFNTLGILGLWNLWRYVHIRNLIKYIFTTFIIFAWLFTFSAATFASLAFGFIISSFLLIIFFKKIKFRKKSIVFLALSLVICIISLLIYKEEIKWLASPVITKISLQQGASGRMHRWERGLGDFLEKPVLGQGIGSASDAGIGSNINWYLSLTVEGGLISSLPIVLFLILSYMRIILSSIPGKFWFMTGFSAGMIHFMAISTFFHPFLWFFLIMFITFNQNFLQGTSKIIINTE